jgi:hypothetical protein
MEPRFLVRRRHREGRCLLDLDGWLDPASAPLLAKEICQAARELAVAHVEVSFAHSAGELDLTVPALLRCLRERTGAPTVELTGLTQHHLRLLGYLGFEGAGEPKEP